MSLMAMLGLTKSKSKTSSNSTTTTNKDTNLAPTMPDWLQGTGQNLFAGINKIAGTDPSKYVADADPLQTKAAGMAGDLGSGPDWFGMAGKTLSAPLAKATSLGKGTALAAGGVPDAMIKAASALMPGKAWVQPTIDKGSMLDGLSNYMSPYTQQVVDATMRDFDYNASMDRSQQTLDMAGAGAFGGSGAALTRSMSDDASARARASTIAGLRDQAFQTGAGLAASDAERRQKASMAAADAAAKGASLEEQQRQYDNSLREQQRAADNALAEQQRQYSGTLAEQQRQFDYQALEDQRKFDYQALEDARKFDAGYNLDLAKTLSGFGTAQDANKRANIDSLFTAGGTMRDIEGEKLTADLQLQQYLTELWGGMNPDMFVGQHEWGTSTENTVGSSKSSGTSISASVGNK